MSTEYNANGTLFTKWISNDLKPEELLRFKESKAYKDFVNETLSMLNETKKFKLKNKRMLKALL